MIESITSADMILIGNGIAPLIAARRLLDQGYRPVLVNPDPDFFEEDSELPFELLDPQTDGALLSQERFDEAAEILQNAYPRALEIDDGKASQGFKDALAPHVRSRARILVAQNEKLGEIENLYLRALDAGLKPQLFEGIQALGKCPGLGRLDRFDKNWLGVWLPRMIDLDLKRYRNGFLDFVQDKLGAERVIRGASGLKLTKQGVSFQFRGRPFHIATQETMVFWSARLARFSEEWFKPNRATVLNLDHWILASPETIDPGTVGIVDDTYFWAEFEGPSQKSPQLLSVVKIGSPPEVASRPSMESVTRFVHDFMMWDHFSVRRYQSIKIHRRIAPGMETVKQGSHSAHLVWSQGGNLVSTVQSTLRACERFS